MGGRFDATNVVTPLVSVITHVSLDHQEHLGSTIARIAFEKAGIIKPGVPVVCGAEDSRALAVIGRQARMMGAPLVRPFGKDGRLETKKTRHGYRFIFKFHDEEFRYAPSLAGAHQGSNAAIAIAAAGIIGRTWRPLRKELVIDGVERARWEGRLETVGRNPAIFLDGAHNEAGALVLRTFIRDRCRLKPVLIFAVMKDKAIPRMVRILFPEVQKVLLPALSYPRAARPEDILSSAGPFRKRIQIVPALKDAIAAAKAEAGFRGTVVITGSLILVGEVKKIFGRTAPVSAPSGTSPVGSPRR
jgi:dihydrofolate synthase/folylpolyglutamate synthase